MKFLEKLGFKRKPEPMFHGGVVKEYLPVFHDKYMNKNKDFQIIEDSFVENFKSYIETQNGVPIKFHKNFNDSFYLPEKFHTGDLNFELNGWKAQMKITISGQGFLENQTNDYTVELVTDKYVYLKKVETSSIILKSYEELETIKEMGGLNMTA